MYVFIYFGFFISLCAYRSKELYISHDWCERVRGAHCDIKMVILRISALFENFIVSHERTSLYLPQTWPVLYSYQ